jgi:hypothetical protein
MFLATRKDTFKAGDFCLMTQVQKWLQEQDVSYCQGLENLIACYDKYLNNFGNYVEK